MAGGGGGSGDIIQFIDATNIDRAIVNVCIVPRRSWRRLANCTTSSTMTVCLSIDFTVGGGDDNDKVWGPEATVRTGRKDGKESICEESPIQYQQHGTWKLDRLGPSSFTIGRPPQIGKGGTIKWRDEVRGWHVLGTGICICQRPTDDNDNEWVVVGEGD